MKYITDLHCHPSFKPFNKKGCEFKKSGREAAPENGHCGPDIWTFVPEKKKDIKNLPRLIQLLIGPTMKHSQSNLNALDRGKVRGVFCAIHPFERGWLARQKNVLTNLLNLFLGYDKKKDRIAAAFAGMEEPRTDRIIEEEIEKKKRVDYFQETFCEYELLSKCTQNTPGPCCSNFVIATNFDEYMDVIHNRPDDIVGILTIEGGHGLGIFPKWNIHMTEYGKLHKKDLEEIRKAYLTNIDKVKGKNYVPDSDIFHPDHTPLFITLTHFYNNFLAGHAKSYSGLTSKVFDQRAGMLGGITDLGLEVIDKLLKRSENERRILIDVKHMSLEARREYYDLLNTKYKGENIPIIYSHGAVTGLSWKEVEGKKDAKLKKRIKWEEKLQKNSILSAMPINICEEDIKAIVKSKGLIGLSPHEGRMPGKKGKKIKNKLIGIEAKWKLFKYHEDVRKFYVKLMMSNIFYIVQKGQMAGRNPWDHICIGSDYDGIMDPFDIYRTSNDFSIMLGDILNYLEDPQEDLDYLPEPISKKQVKKMIENSGYEPLKLVEKIAYLNTEQFLKEYFTESYLKKEKVTNGQAAANPV